MAVIRVKMIPEFYYGDDALLLAADREGLEAFERALSDAANNENVSTQFISDGVIHEFAVEGDEARVECHEGRVAWHVSAEKLSEILEKVSVLKAANHPSHHYVDIDSPAKTLILSVDEY